MAARHHVTYLASAAIAAAIALPALTAVPASAATLDDLHFNVQSATNNYQAAVVEQVRNSSEIVAVKNEISIAQSEIAQSKEQLSDAVSTLYKNERHRSDLVDFVLDGSSLTDAINRYEGYVRIESFCREKLERVRNQQSELNDKKKVLEEKKDVLKEKIAAAAQAIEDAEEALRDADHSDGLKYHQKQGNGSNCGATSFIVGVNILLHENRYPNNVSVWKGPGFKGDSTVNLGFKAKSWLMANGLSDKISVETIAGDIHRTEQLKAELDQAHVVIISSGPGSVWQRADGTSTGPGTFPDGHWIVFYHEKDGVFYANDSSVDSKKGAGCAYTEKQMQQWLDGRSNHFAVSLAKK